MLCRCNAISVAMSRDIERQANQNILKLNKSMSSAAISSPRVRKASTSSDGLTVTTSANETPEVEIAPLWTPNQALTNCEQCRVGFSLIFRRHHCR